MENKYTVQLLTKALLDLDDIATYLAFISRNPSLAKSIVDSISDKIFSLELFPYRGIRKQNFNNSLPIYYQLHFKNYTIIYCIFEEKKIVLVVTVYQDSKLLPFGF